jgi:branched-chain amino acid transport system substrate-binding protein
MRPLLAQAVGIIAGLLAITSVQAEVIRFGAVLPLTGSCAQVGIQQMRGIQFAVDRVNAAGGVRGAKIEILFEDGQADPERSATAFEELADVRKVPMIFVASAAPSLALAPLATDKEILLVNADAQDDRLATASPYLINTLPAIRDEVKVLSRYLVGNDMKRGTILFDNNPAAIARRDDFEKYFSEAGGTILSLEPVRNDQIDYRPSLLKLAYVKPDVMMVSVSTGLRAIMRQESRLGLAFTVAATSFVANGDILASPSFGRLVHTQIHTSSAPQLAAEFKARFEMEMGFPASQYYDATQVALAVTDRLLSEAKPVTGKNLLAMLFAIRTFQGLTALDFTTNTATVPLDVHIAEGGRDVPVEQ